MVAVVIEANTRYRLDVGFNAVIHPHHAFLEDQCHLQMRQPREDNLVRQPPPAIGVGLGAVDAVGSPTNSLTPQKVAVGADVGDPAEVDVREQPRNRIQRSCYQ